MYGSQEYVPTSEFEQEIKAIFEEQLEASINSQIKDSIINGIDYSDSISHGLENISNSINNLITFPGIKTKNNSESLKKIKLICDKFDQVVRQLELRKNGLKIKNEYDVQNVFHSLLTLYFDDIRREEYVPSAGGANSRVDFLLKPEQILIEIKKTRSSHNNKKLGEELIIDIDRYPNHPDCKNLVFFIYDPDRIIINPRGFENDFEGKTNNINIKVFIRPE